jgi:hypothetical protein
VDQQRLPNLSEALVTALAVQFPDQSADLSWPEKEIWFKAGQVSVVRWLTSRLQEQNENGLELEVP